MQLWADLDDLFSGAKDTVSAGYKSAVDTLSTAVSDLGQTAQGWSAEWQAQVDKLKAKAQEFTRVFSALQADAANVPAELKPSYDALMQRGTWVKNQIQSITNGIDFGWNMFQSLPFMSGVKNLGGMGVLPLIPIAVITGGVAVIVAWLADAYTMQQKINLAKSVKANASQLPGILGAGSGSGGIANFFTSAGTLLVIGLAAYLLLPTIKKALQK